MEGTSEGEPLYLFFAFENSVTLAGSSPVTCFQARQASMNVHPADPCRQRPQARMTLPAGVSLQSPVQKAAGRSSNGSHRLRRQALAKDIRWGRISPSNVFADDHGMAGRLMNRGLEADRGRCRFNQSATACWQDPAWIGCGSCQFSRIRRDVPSDLRFSSTCASTFSHHSPCFASVPILIITSDDGLLGSRTWWAELYRTRPR
jgi:hypothetical protein